MSKVLEGLRPNLFEGIIKKKTIKKRIPEKSGDYFNKHPKTGKLTIPYVSRKEYEEVWEQ